MVILIDVDECDLLEIPRLAKKQAMDGLFVAISEKVSSSNFSLANGSKDSLDRPAPAQLLRLTPVVSCLKQVVPSFVLAWMLSVSAAAVAPDFSTEVLPILKNSCFQCHGPEKQKSGYRLDVRDIALRGGDSGEAAIVPHDAKRSPLIRLVSGEDEELLMPPKKSTAPRLTPEEVATLRAWIDAGPAWPDELAGLKNAGPPHWADSYVSRCIGRLRKSRERIGATARRLQRAVSPKE